MCCQFFGFILLISGTLIYNEIVEIKFFELNKYTRTQIAKRKKEEEGETEEERLFRESTQSNDAVNKPTES